MIDKNRIISAYLDDVCQSLQAPVQSIAAYADFLIEHFFKCRDDARLADARRIEQAATDLLVSIDKIAAKSTDNLALSMVRHDLRNTIGLVSGYADMLLEDADVESVAPVVEYLELILREAQNFLERLEELAGKIAASPSNTAAVERVFDSFRGAVQRDLRDSSGGRVLVVDDNDSSRELLLHQLDRQGYEVLGAVSGRSGLALIRAEEPDLVLLDLLMPDINGYELLRMIREDDSLRHIPVIMVSGIKDQQGAIRCIDAGASDYLTKPVNTTLLRARVAALLERKRWQDKERLYLAELEKSHDFIRRVFGRYLSDEVVQRLLDESGGLNLGGERREVTILMADIRGFSDISQRLSPEDCVLLLNNYLGAMTDIIMANRGTVDEFVGDAILAIFGAPVDEGHHAENALACALAMQRAMSEVNRYNEDKGLPAIEIGIGLNTGPVVVGNIGSERRTKYGVVGHHVNLTSRVESCTVGGQVLVSAYTLAAISVPVDTGQVLEVDVKGSQEPLKLYEVLGIGEPYNLHLDRYRSSLEPLSTPIAVEVTLLRGKQVAPVTGQAVIKALSERELFLQQAPALPPLANVCLRMLGRGDEASAEPFYAKVTKAGQAGEYTLTLTSTPEAVREFFSRSRRALPREGRA